MSLKLEAKGPVPSCHNQSAESAALSQKTGLAVVQQKRHFCGTDAQDWFWNEILNSAGTVLHSWLPKLAC